MLYYNAATVEMFDIATMASKGLLMPPGNPTGSGGLFTPSSMAFGPDGNLYISGGTFGAVNGSNITNLNAANVSGASGALPEQQRRTAGRPASSRSSWVNLRSEWMSS